jgi:hydrogenase maturation protein HypF
MCFQLRGRVQGVGCRPYIYRLAAGLGLTGFVRNDTAGIRIEVQGPDEALAAFGRTLHAAAAPDWPALMHISRCQADEIPFVAGEAGFQIIGSEAQGTPSAGVAPDTAVCGACLAELADPNDFRFRYPFITCTHCGPRYSIIKTIPYDRPNTTMAEFALCPRCQRQYDDVGDRRFHAQPVACPACGPRVWLADARGEAVESDPDRAIARAAAVLREGKIVAIKGIGGFHLAADALNEDAVLRLRQRKRRQAKPFAMMAAEVETVRRYACVDAAAEALLVSPQRPIVLLEKKQAAAIAPSAAQGTHCFGFMLCYAPVHYLLFAEEGISVLVMTSANFSEEPLICDNAQAVEELGDVADAFLMHDRPIYRQTDDSVAQIVAGGPAFLRRARGVVPEPLIRQTPSGRVVFAAGADLKNTFCFLKGDQYLLSEHIGDLAEGRAYRHYIKSVGHFQRLFEAVPEAVVCDLHPGYFSTHFAEQMHVLPLIRVQHHWAHVASALAEHNHAGPVIGLVADGTGYGTDGAIWGGECLIASLTEFTRFGHLAYYPLAGGDKAAKEAIRPLLGLLTSQGRLDAIEPYRDILRRIEPDDEKVRLICTQIEKGLNTSQTSSLGRLFDAAAALCGLGAVNRFEAELPMAMEALTRAGEDAAYPVELTQQADGMWLWRVEPVMAGLMADVRREVSAGTIATRFHNTVCEALLVLAQKARAATGLDTVALSGGVFCNRYLAERLIRRLKDEGFGVLWKRCIPANDGGIALGQAAIAAAMLEKH